MVFEGMLSGKTLVGTTTGPDGTLWQWTAERAPSLRAPNKTQKPILGRRQCRKASCFLEVVHHPNGAHPLFRNRQVTTIRAVSGPRALKVRNKNGTRSALRASRLGCDSSPPHRRSATEMPDPIRTECIRSTRSSAAARRTPGSTATRARRCLLADRRAGKNQKQDECNR